MNGKICLECHFELRPQQNGVIAVEMGICGALALWRADVWECLECGWPGIFGAAFEPFAIGSSDQLDRRINAELTAGSRVIRFWMNARERDLYHTSTQEET